MKLTLSIKSKLIGIIPIIVVLLFVSTIISYHRTIDAIREVAKNDLNTMVTMVKEFVRDENNQNKEFLEEICNRKLVIGKKGFVFIVSKNGELYIHKKVQGENWAQKPHIREILQKRNGVIRYLSPKTGTYKIAAFQHCGVLDRIIVASVFESDLIGDVQSKILKETMVSSFFIVLLLVGLMVIIIRGVTKPIAQLSGTFDQVISDGESLDLGHRAEVNSKDEMGVLAAGFNQLLDNMHSLIRQNGKNANSLLNLSHLQEASVQQIAATTEEMSSQSDTIDQSAKRSAENMKCVSSSALEMSQSVNAVTAAIEEMGATASEIAKHCNKESEIAKMACDQADKTNELMVDLERSASEIAGVLEAIRTISAQTNLLALNATIEAASAGEAGKGFAVVANEVKDLAKQTAQLTDEISEKVGAITTSTDGSIIAIRDITKIIDQVNQISESIVISVDQQSSAINEIADTMSAVSIASNDVSDNVSASAEGVANISKNIGGFNDALNELTANMHQLEKGTGELAEMSESVSQTIHKIKV